MANGEKPWRVGSENPRESVRFRYPVCDRTDDWPWLALFERQADADLTVRAVNEYPVLVAQGIALRKEAILAGEEIELLRLLLARTRFEGELDDDLADEIDVKLGLEVAPAIKQPAKKAKTGASA